MARTRPPSGWIEVGKLLVSVEEGRPTSFEAQDADGKVIEKRAAPPDRRSAQELMATLTCHLGGLLLTLDGKPPKSGIATFTVLKPNAPDEKADIALLCRKPDEDQEVRVAAEIYQERLTTKKWRAWLKDAPTRATAAAEELASAANGPCWFAQRISVPR